jgi:hypothetical protein
MVNAVIDRSFFLVMPDSIGHVPVFVRLLFFFIENLYFLLQSHRSGGSNYGIAFYVQTIMCMYQKQIQKNKIRLKV